MILTKKHITGYTLVVVILAVVIAFFAFLHEKIQTHSDRCCFPDKGLKLLFLHDKVYFVCGDNNFNPTRIIEYEHQKKEQ